MSPAMQAALEARGLAIFTAWYGWVRATVSRIGDVVDVMPPPDFVPPRRGFYEDAPGVRVHSNGHVRLMGLTAPRIDMVPAVARICAAHPLPTE